MSCCVILEVILFCGLGRADPISFKSLLSCLVSEGKVLCHPASADSIPTCGGFEDHVSMGGFSARKSEQVVSNAEKGLYRNLNYHSTVADFESIIVSYFLYNKMHRVYFIV